MMEAEYRGVQSEDYWRGYADGNKDAKESGVLQAVLDAIKGTLDPHSQIADHPNVKFAQMERLKLLAPSHVVTDDGDHPWIGKPTQ
jgi:hypothetical protein